MMADYKSRLANFPENRVSDSNRNDTKILTFRNAFLAILCTLNVSVLEGGLAGI
jgi:hypothetical protein